MKPVGAFHEGVTILSNCEEMPECSLDENRAFIEYWFIEFDFLSAFRWSGKSMAEVLRQSAVIPIMEDRVCLITSSSGKRWIVPKGMIDPGHTAGESALIEAWEEAGLVGVLRPEPVGSFLYEKYGKKHHVTVFVMEVHELASDWPERSIRRREWVSPEKACERLEELGLRLIIESLFRTESVQL